MCVCGGEGAITCVIKHSSLIPFFKSSLTTHVIISNHNNLYDASKQVVQGIFHSECFNRHK